MAASGCGTKFQRTGQKLYFLLRASLPSPKHHFHHILLDKPDPNLPGFKGKGYKLHNLMSLQALMAML